MNLTSAQIRALVAIYVLQPATTTAINFYLGRADKFGNDAVASLVDLKLVERYKWTPPELPPMTEAQRLGFEDYPHKPKIGKRPYLYRLTPAASAAAFHLHEAMQALPETEEETA